MTLGELVKTLKGSIVASIQWRDEGEDLKEILTHIHLIRFCDEKLLNREVLKIEIGSYTINISLKRERQKNMEQENKERMIKEKIIKAYKELNGVEPTKEQVEGIYKAFNECELV